MDALLKKLNYKGGDACIVKDAVRLAEALKAQKQSVSTRVRANSSFFLAFVKKQAEITRLAAAIEKIESTDPVIWFAYPKQSSKKYSCDFNRDQGWAPIGALGYEGVRMVAIDEDWSALRFRRVDRIKKMSRSTLGAISKEGKRRVKRKKPSQ